MFVSDEAEQIFHELVPLDRVTREQELENRCAHNPKLKGEVESLLLASQSADDFFTDFSKKLTTLTQAELEADTPEVEKIGPWRLLDLLGRGGMGAVYLAERADRQYERRVALKLLSGNAADPVSRFRFQSEKNILAQLNHENIAHFLDGGVTEAGAPYIVMEYVDGQPLDRYCADNHLDIDARLKLFLKICDAVAYAHRHFVIHRDIKPANVLVNSNGQIKLLDFGIAKLADNDASPDLTQLAWRPLTPAYASPEMRRGETVDITSDIFSLGVLLYELLTETKPPEFNGEPPKPSQAAINKYNRRVLKGDLDAITLKALKESKAQRYQSVEPFAEDIRDFLSGNPVSARPDSWLYVSRKFISRHRSVTAVSVLFVLSLLTITALSVRYATVTSRQAERILLENKRAESIKSFLLGILKSADPNIAPVDVTVKDVVLSQFNNLKDEFTDDRETKIELLQAFVDVFQILRLPEKQVEALRQQLELIGQRDGENSQDYATALLSMASAREKTGDYPAAFASNEKALEIALLLDNRALAARAYHQTGLLHHLKGELAEAENYYRQAFDIRNTVFGEQHLETARTIMEMGILEDEKGNHENAEALLRKALAIRENLLGKDHSELGELLVAIGTTLSRQGKPQEAIVVNRQALALYEKNFGPDSQHSVFALGNIGHDYFRMRDYENAKAEFTKTLALVRKFTPNHPDEGLVLANIGDVEYSRDDCGATIETYRAALAVFETHMPQHLKLFQMRLRIGLCLGNSGQFEEAQSWFAPAFEELKKRPEYPKTILKRNAEQVIDVYRAWGKSEKIAYYQNIP